MSSSAMAALADALTTSTPPSAADLPTLPAFPAAALITLQGKFEKSQREMVQKWIDSLRTIKGLNPADAAACKLVRRTVTRAFEDAKEPPADSTIRAYALGAMRAFGCNVPWAAGLHKDKAIRCAWETTKKKAAEPAKADTAKREELDAAIVQAIKLARALGLKDVAVTLATVATERLTGFKVPADK